MSRLDDLIQNLCPDGVEYKSLDYLFVLKNGYTPSKKNDEYWHNGTVPWFRLEDIRTNGRVLSDAKQHVTSKAVKGSLFPANSIIVSTTATIGEHALIESPFLINQQLTCVSVKEQFKAQINIKFVFYYFEILKEDLQRMASQSGNMPIVSLAKMKQLLIPIPPLEVQKEIVRLLDDFTAKTAELQAELNKEYETRKTQCEYYHNNLMNFSDKNIECKTVGELFEIKNGLNKPKEAFGHGKPIVNFTDVYNKRWLTHDLFQGLVDVDEDEIKRYSAKKGDVFFTRTSETKEDIGMSCTLIDDVPDCVYSGFLLRARPITNLLLPKFCSYYFSTDYVRKTIVRYAAFTTRATTTGPKLSKIEVPILPLEEQQRIVDILDDFYLALNKLQSELPAEIESRQKQYEYYRDKLLTFKELNESEVN